VRSVRSQTGQSPSTPLLRTIPPPPPYPFHIVLFTCTPITRPSTSAHTTSRACSNGSGHRGIIRRCAGPSNTHCAATVQAAHWAPQGNDYQQALATHCAGPSNTQRELSHRMNHPRGGHTPTAGAHSSTRQLKQNSSCSPGPLPLLEEERPRARQRAERAPAA
jgi:hypothetical protein